MLVITNGAFPEVKHGFLLIGIGVIEDASSFLNQLQARAASNFHAVEEPSMVRHEDLFSNAGALSWQYMHINSKCFLNTVATCSSGVWFCHAGETLHCTTVVCNLVMDDCVVLFQTFYGECNT